jgi:hypothetical protein
MDPGTEIRPNHRTACPRLQTLFLVLDGRPKGGSAADDAGGIGVELGFGVRVKQEIDSPIHNAKSRAIGRKLPAMRHTNGARIGKRGKKLGGIGEKLRLRVGIGELIDETAINGRAASGPRNGFPTLDR